MNLVFIHGRAQGGKSEAIIHQSWKAGMERGFTKAGVQPTNLTQIQAPFYGDILDELTTQARSGAVTVIDRGGSSDEVEFDPFVAALIEQMAKRAGIDRKQVEDEAELTVVERGPERWEWVQALGRRVSSRAPWLADYGIGRFTADVKAYLDNPYIRHRIHEIVVPALSADPCVVVAHSLGTVVAYWALTENPTLRVPLLITAGSPLGIDAIKSYLPPPLGFPSTVQKWLNVTDQRDFVALYARLDQDTFIEGIENLSEVDNGDDPHDITRYLEDTTVARRLAAALS